MEGWKWENFICLSIEVQEIEVQYVVFCRAVLGNKGVTLSWTISLLEVLGQLIDGACI